MRARNAASEHRRHCSDVSRERELCGRRTPVSEPNRGVDGRGRWFYERARGAYLAADQKATLRKTEHKIFKAQTPKNRRVSKLDLARYLSAWDGYPHRVCLGGQKNFQFFMQRMNDHRSPSPDADWFRRLVAIAIVYRSSEKIVRLMKFPAYRAQIVAYLVSGFSHRTGGRLDFESV